MVATALTGCYDLQTEPYNQYVTEDQKVQVKNDNPEMARASLTGITGLFSTYCQILDQHNDFGIPAVMLFLDNRAVDMVSDNIGYNWFRSGSAMNDCAPNSDISYLAWQHYYRQVFAANAAIKSIDPETEDPELQFYMAQGYAMRANDYFNLAQIFQFTYVGNQDKPCVMLITEKNSD